MVREQRRLAAILFADAVGSSLLMGRDESTIVARLLQHLNRRLAPAVVRRGGRVIRLKGDGALIEFASAVDALASAIEFQQAMVEATRDELEDKAIVFRIGLHLGDVIVEEDDIYGDAVNVAARLEAEAPPGGIVVSRAVCEAVQGRVKATFHALGDLDLKNIVRPIRAFRVEWSAQDWPASKAEPVIAIRSQGSAKDGAPRLSLVVLPFTNIGGDSDQEYFADGVTDSLTTDLSRSHGMLVIGRNTAFTYKGKHIDSKQLGRELGVRYVLEGSVQRSGNRMRVNTQLIDATTGIHLWAERFDKPIADFFDMQDEIIARISRQLGTQLTAAEAQRAKRSANPDSLDMFFQGAAWLFKASSAECLSQARHYFEGALTVDPDNVQALAMRAHVDLLAARFIETKDRAARLAATEAALTKVLSLEPEYAFAHASLGFLKILTNRACDGIADCEQALALNRNLVTAHALIGLAKIYTGRCEETDAHIQEAIRLSPRDTFAYTWMSIAGLAKLLLGSDEEAAILYRRSIEMNRNEPLAHFYLAAALAHVGRLAEARAALQAGLAIEPRFTIRGYQARLSSDHPTYLLQNGRVIAGLRKAGVPEE